jgi:hypothetical protein
MVPTWNLAEGAQRYFEPINEIHVHAATMQQLFVPVPESREFTRKDAAKAFGDHVLTPEEKLQIPELVGLQKDLASGADPSQAKTKFYNEVAKNEAAFAERMKLKQQKEDKKKQQVDVGRFEYRFENVNVDAVGHNGRGRAAVGHRYGVPFDDRKKGAIKIPIKVE